jgi:hypothetical protein
MQRLPDFRVPPSACPHCGKLADGALATTGIDPPKAGDAMLCSECGSWLIYTAAMGRRAPTADETEGIAQHPWAQRCWLAWLATR